MKYNLQLKYSTFQTNILHMYNKLIEFKINYDTRGMIFMEDKHRKYVQALSMLSLISQVGLMILIPILGCAFIGKYLDDKFGTSPFLLLIFLLLGIGGAFSGVYKTLIVYARRKWLNE